MKKLFIVLFFSSLPILGQNKFAFSITGKLKISIESEIIVANRIMIQLTPGPYITTTDSLGNFSFDVVKAGSYKLELLEYEQSDSDLLRLEVKDKPITNIELVAKVFCNLNKRIAKSDVEQGIPKLLLIGGIAPVYLKDQEKTEKKYGFQYYDFGCTPPPKQCVLLYNQIVFKHLDEKFGKTWRNEVRSDVIGLK